MTEHMDDTLTITLPQPVAANGAEYSELTLREPTIGDMIEMMKAKTDLEQTQKLISLCSGLPIPAVSKLPIRVVTQAADFFARFIPPSPPTGAK
ncbi:phage tail assembly protein [Teichococcus cervicalis]|uniref:Phage tail protein E n=1 Tax=Pseudoroseomonas cervicalis ATCC 49957 TaxID=525371 RepID=D5RTF6_9PROT|nr:phage tail assembly protein [Pseudoroseomonas cervicalis]EFH09387.1 hypothetical protein HMPREF0731_4368 [Pseudoroseomonas cervicalis ATCC 49957]